MENRSWCSSGVLFITAPIPDIHIHLRFPYTKDNYEHYRPPATPRPWPTCSTTNSDLTRIQVAYSALLHGATRIHLVRIANSVCQNQLCRWSPQSTPITVWNQREFQIT
ncbi:hypothetical protein QTP88_021681 [Uroleucon formosanum]